MDHSEVFDALREILAKTKIPWREIREGLVLEFVDGCDIFLVDDRAIEASRKKTAQAVAVDLLAAFQKLDKRRTAVLLGLRHWASETDCAIAFSSSGSWALEQHGGTSFLHVGHSLTDLIRNQGAESALQQLLKQHYFDAPTVADLRRLIAYKTPPREERPTQNDPDELAVHLKEMMRTRTDEELQEARLTHRRKRSQYDLAERLRERLGEERVNVGCCLPKDIIQIDFTDGESFFAFHSSPAHLKKLVSQHGTIEAVVDYLHNKFTRIDQARIQTLQALDSLLANRGCFKDDSQWNREGWWYGTSHQQYHVDPGVPLTRKLNRQSRAEFIQKWCEENQVAPTVSIEEIEAALTQPPSEIPRRMLPPVSYEAGPQIPQLESWNFMHVDQVAREWIDTFRTEAEKPETKQQTFPIGTLHYWDEPQWFARESDTWVDDAWWIERAGLAWEAAEARRKPYIASQQSATILLAYGDDRPRERVIKRYQEMGFYHPEAIEDGLAWVLEGELPWSMLDYDDFEFPVQLGKVPPQQARRVAIELREALDNDSNELNDVDDFDALRNFAKVDRLSAEEWLAPHEIEQVHQWCLCWASATDDPAQFWDTYPLQIATTFAWTDVADRIEQNPITPTSLLSGEPGSWYLADFVLWLSRLNPNRYAARWAAYLLAVNAEAASHQSVAKITNDLFRGSNKKLFPDQNEVIRELTVGHIKAQRARKLAAAIAWHRCREAGTIG
ncbi:hypothetical protein DTL21_08620 [Bremerella cremea]|uniref:Uncharacterized protein n=1 Tax=Blastopirellula marina TaxID=124 RepID=A0A2S8FUX2_9BACT|nr:MULTISPECIES: hypothetical protein [Pirellulaceae]PQO35979.1 hypothetical protein C5Y83_08615 [Blastopirellula marina]RCS48656.1 hypothetical protein DTL21_08620 [Bremerella cremea]